MKVLLIVVLLNAIPESDMEISKALIEYIETKARLQKYSVTTSVDYTRNQRSFVEENLYFDWKDMIPIRNKSYFKDKVLNVTVFSQNHYQFDCKATVVGNTTFMEGYSIEILKLLQNILSFNIRYTIIEHYKASNDSASLRGSLRNNVTDLILCYPMMYNSSQVDVLHPILKTSYVIVFDPAKLSFTKDIFILTFAGTLWLCFIIVLILLAVCLRVSTTQYKKIYGYAEWGIVEITFWAIATACQQGLTTNPFGFATRAIIFLGAMTAYLLYTGFAAGITSLVAVQNQDFKLTIEEIEKMKVNVVSFGNIMHLPGKYSYLKSGNEVERLENFFKQLNERHWIGVSVEMLLEQYFRTARQIDYCSYTVMILSDAQFAMSMLVPRNSKYKSVFNYWLIRMQEDGITNGTFLRKQRSLDGCSAAAGFSSAKLEHVKSAIAVLIVGLIASVVFLTGECIWNGYKHRKQRHRTLAVTDFNN